MQVFFFLFRPTSLLKVDRAVYDWTGYLQTPWCTKLKVLADLLANMLLYSRTEQVIIIKMNKSVLFKLLKVINRHLLLSIVASTVLSWSDISGAMIGYECLTLYFCA